MGTEILVACFSYLMGIIPNGQIVGLLHGINISEHGSGNVGATNIGRTLGKRAGIIVLGLDILKGVLPIAIVHLFTPQLELRCLAGVSVVAGHCFSIPRFLKGGKGVATGLGVALALSPVAALCSLLSFAAAFVLSNIVSLSSLIAAAILPLAALFSGAPDDIFRACALISAIIAFRHRSNIERIVRGIEPQYSSASLGQRKE